MLGLSRQHCHTLLAVHHIQLDCAITQISWVLVDCLAGIYYEPATVRLWREAEPFAPLSLEHTLSCLWQTAVNVEKDFRRVVVVTLGGVLLERTLPTQLGKKGLAIPSVFNSYFDLAAEFKECFGVDGKSAAEMAAISGDASKVSDIHYMAKVILAMLSRQYTFRNLMFIDRVGAKTISTQEVNGIKREEKPVLESSYFKLRGLPYRATKRQIKEFLEVADMDEEEDIIYLFYNDKFNGNAIVRVPMSHSDKVREKHDQHLMTRYIEVLPSTREEFLRVKPSFGSNYSPGYRQPSMNYQQQQPYVNDHRPQLFPPSDRDRSRSRNRQQRRSRSPSSGSAVSYRSGGSEGSNLENKGILKMIGLPYSCTRSEVLDFFEPHHPIESSLKFGARDGRRTGDALILFESRREADAALELDRKKIGTRYIELSKVTPDQYRKFVW